MAKISSVIFALLAIQVTFAFDTWKTTQEVGDIDDIVTKIQSTTADLASKLESRFMNKNIQDSLPWEIRQLSFFVQNVIDNLENLSQTYNTNTTRFGHLIKQFKNIKASLDKPITNAEDIKTLLNVNIQILAELLVNFPFILENNVFEVTPYNLPNAQGSLHQTIKTLLVKFSQLIQTVQNQLSEFENVPYQIKKGKSAEEAASQDDSSEGFEIDEEEDTTKTFIVGYDVRTMMMNRIKFLAEEFSSIIRTSPDNMMTVDAIATEAHKLAKILKKVIEKLQKVMIDNSALKKLFELQMSLEFLSGNAVSDVKEFKMKFEKFVLAAVVEIEKLAMISAEYVWEDWSSTIRKILHVFLKGMRSINDKFQRTRQIEFNVAKDISLKKNIDKSYEYDMHIDLNQFGKDIVIDKHGYKNVDGSGRSYGVAVNLSKNGKEMGFEKNIVKNAEGVNKEFSKTYLDETKKIEVVYTNKAEIVKDIREMIKKIDEQLKSAVGLSNEDLKEVLFLHSRKLWELIDQIVEIKNEFKNNDETIDIFMDLQHMQDDFEKSIGTGRMITFYQIKNFFIDHLEKFTARMEKLMSILEENQLVKEALIKFIQYLRDLNRQFQFENFGYTKLDLLVSHLQILLGDFAEIVKEGRFDSAKTQEYAEAIEELVAKIEARSVLEKDEVLAGILRDLNEIFYSVRARAGALRFKIGLSKELEGIVDELQRGRRFHEEKLA